MHITASVFVNGAESGLHRDYAAWLEQLAPHEPVARHQHNRTDEDNADAQLKRQVMGREVVVAGIGIIRGTAAEWSGQEDSGECVPRKDVAALGK